GQPAVDGGEQVLESQCIHARPCCRIGARAGEERFHGSRAQVLNSSPPDRVSGRALSSDGQGSRCARKHTSPGRKPPFMTVFRIAPAVTDAFPGTLIALITATGLRGHESWPGTVQALADLERQLAEGTWSPADESDPRIEAWHTAYRSFGVNPRRVRPSVDALGRRMAKKGSLPRINPAV